MSLTPLERKALFKAAVTLRRVTMAQAAEQLGVSYNHLTLVLRGDRVGSARLEAGVATFIGRPVEEVFGGNGERGSRRTRRPKSYGRRGPQ